MRVLIISLFLAFGYSNGIGDFRGAPQLSLIQERTANGAPSVSITFPDGHKDMLVMHRFFGNEEDRMVNEERCHYSGHLANEPEACVAMTGCVGREDVEFTILSEHSHGSHILKWTTEGNVEILEYKRDRQRPPIDYDDDEEFSEAADFDDRALPALPATQHLQIRTGYGDGFRAKAGGDAQAQNHIKASWTHVQTYFCHTSMPSRILVERMPGIKYYQGKTIEPTSTGQAGMRSDTQNDLNGADLMAYFGSSNTGVVGRADGLGYVCSNTHYRKQSINVYESNAALMAVTVVHEVGHNLGMHHDFSQKHGGTGWSSSTNACNVPDTGFMSYATWPHMWSVCSVNDLKEQYQ